MKFLSSLVLATAALVSAQECYDVKEESACLSSFEGEEKCVWCSSAAVSASCVKESDAATLPPSVFQCSGLEVKEAGCDSYTTHDSCLAASEDGETCAWCNSAAVSASCAKKSQAETLPESVFQCEYQAWYMEYVAQAVGIVKSFTQ